MEDLEIEIDFGGQGIAELERGGKCTQPGWYLTVLEDVARKKEEKLDFIFVVQSGPWKGSKIWDTLYMPGYSNTPEKEQQTIKKLGMYAQRLGLWDGEPAGAKRINWADAIGKPIVVEVATRKYKDDAGEEKSITGPSYAGIFPPDHPKIPDAIRQALKLPPARPEKSKDSKGQQYLPADTGEPEFKAIPNVSRKKPLDLEDL